MPKHDICWPSADRCHIQLAATAPSETGTCLKSEATAVMEEQPQSCCQPPTHLEQQVSLRRAREMKPFLLSSALCSRIPAVVSARGGKNSARTRPGN